MWSAGELDLSEHMQVQQEWQQARPGTGPLR